MPLVYSRSSEMAVCLQVRGKQAESREALHRFRLCCRQDADVGFALTHRGSNWKVRASERQICPGF